MKKPVVILFTLILALVSGCIGYYLGNKPTAQIFSTKQFSSPLRYGKPGLTNPLLDYETSEDMFTGELKSFKSEIENIISDEKQKGHVTDASFYFRAMKDGPWFAINQSMNYIPASLLKVPVMIAYLKDAQSNPDILKTEITFTDKSLNTSEINNFKPSKHIELDKKYTVENLLRYMIQYSDNNALNVLVTPGFEDKYIQVFRDIGVPYNVDDLPDQNIMSTHAYATFFRVLYNASYLNRDMSEKALALLSSSDFTGGIRAGIPKDVVYAGKFGERAVGNIEQLHDCGIVYHPQNPYLICVMTRGSNFSDLEKVIGRISKATWNSIDTQIKQSKN